jgi:phage terminase large subunit
MRSSQMLERERKLLKICEDPTHFAELILGHDVWSKQDEILQSVAHYPRTAVKACHASSKTFTAAELVLWWITSQPDRIAVTTAPTWLQVERLLWGEIRTAAANAKITYPKPSATELKLGTNRYAIGLATNEGVRFQGFHGSVLVVVDEAPGVMPEIWEAIESIRAGGDVRVLALGNPLISSGPFYDAFTANREAWNLITISAFDTPNLQGLTIESLLKLSEEELDQNVRPYLTTRRWVKEKYSEWGLGHPLWESRVLGNFPLQSDNALISLTWLEQAKLREDGDGEVCAGLDVAGPGEDETVLCVRRGPKIVLLRAWAGRDARGDVLAALEPYKAKLEKVNVDTVGIGFFMAQHLRDHGLPVMEINVGESSRDSDKYANLKAEYYWGFRMRAQSGDLAGLKDEKTIAQIAGIRYSHNARGQIVIESKADARKRGVKSPDRAEAVILAFAERPPSVYGYIDFLKHEQARIDNQQPTTTESCSKCGATTCIVRIPGGLRCNHCGNQTFEAPDCKIWTRRDLKF